MTTYNGTRGDDNIRGSYGADTLNGGAGDDILDGSRGQDTLDGGDGNDTLKAGYDWGQGDRFIGGAGIDTYVIDGTEVDHFAFDVNLVTGTDRYHNTYTGIENVIGGDRGDELTGDSNDNIFEGRNGNDVLNGGGGNDTLDGGNGNDVIIGGQADDELVKALVDAKTGTRDEIRDALGDSDGSSIDPTSVDDADVLIGGNGNDLLLGMRGNDVVSGGNGKDVLYGNSGNDTIDGGSGNDTIYGGKNDDVIKDGSGNDTVFGDSGDDTVLAGKGGKDNYVGGSGFDSLDYSNAGDKGLTIDLSKGTVRGGNQKDTINGFESIIASSGDDIIKGSRHDDSIDGADGNDVIRGYKGSDTLTGGEGADRYTWERKDLDGIDSITDFDMKNDTLDFRNLIKATKYEDISDIINVDQTEDGALVSVYAGNDYGWHEVVLLEDVKTDADTLFDDGLMFI